MYNFQVLGVATNGEKLLLNSNFLLQIYIQKDFNILR